MPGSAPMSKAAAAPDDQTNNLLKHGLTFGSVRKSQVMAPQYDRATLWNELQFGGAEGWRAALPKSSPLTSVQMMHWIRPSTSAQ
jgi:hypothetical protein